MRHLVAILRRYHLAWPIPAFAIGCAAAPQAKSAATAAAVAGLQASEQACEKMVLAVVDASASCPEAVHRLEELALREPACAGFMGDVSFADQCRGGK